MSDEPYMIEEGLKVPIPYTINPIPWPSRLPMPRRVPVFDFSPTTTPAGIGWSRKLDHWWVSVSVAARLLDVNANLIYTLAAKRGFRAAWFTNPGKGPRRVKYILLMDLEHYAAQRFVWNRMHRRASGAPSNTGTPEALMVDQWAPPPRSKGTDHPLVTGVVRTEPDFGLDKGFDPEGERAERRADQEKNHDQE